MVRMFELGYDAKLACKKKQTNKATTRRTIYETLCMHLEGKPSSVPMLMSVPLRMLFRKSDEGRDAGKDRREPGDHGNL